MSLSNTIVDREVDWDAAVAAAEGLGRITLVYVAQRDAEAVREWCLQRSRTHVGEGNALRALSYLELAVLTGHYEEEVDVLVRGGWDELVKAAVQLVASVRLKAKEAAGAAIEAKAGSFVPANEEAGAAVEDEETGE